jgi:hypothetical protein
MNMRNQLGDDDDQEFDPEARPAVSGEPNPYDDGLSDAERAEQEMIEKHDRDMRLEAEYEREEAEAAKDKVPPEERGGEG